MMVVAPVIPTLGKHRQAALYRVNSRIAKAIQKPCLKKNKNKNKKAVCAKK